MATNQQLAELILRYTVDQKALRKSLADNAALQKSVQQVGAAQATLANTSKQVEAELASVGRSKQFDAIALSFAKGDINAKQLVATLSRLKATQQEIRGVVQEADRLAASLTRAEIAGQQHSLTSGGRLQGGRLGRIGSELRLLPSVPLPGGFSSDQLASVVRIAGAANRALTLAGTSLGTLGAAAGIASPVLIGAALAVLQFNRSTEQFTQGVKAAITAQDAYYEALRENTTQQTQEQLDKLRRDQEILRQQRDETRAALGGAFQDPNRSILADVGRIASIGAIVQGIAADRAGVTDLQEQWNKLNTEFLENEQTIARLEQGLSANTFAANDAREAEERLAEARRDAALAAADAARSDQNEIGALLRGTGESALNRRAQLEDDARGLEAAIRSLQASGETGEEVDKQLEAYRTELDGVRSDIATITRLLPQIRLQEVIRGAPEAFDKLAKNVADFNAETERIADARKLSADRDQLAFIIQRTRALAAFERSQAQAEVKQVQRENELRARIAEIDSEADDQAKERTAEHNKALQQLAKDHQDRIFDITQDGALAVSDAIDARNSQAALKAQRELARATERENRDYDKAKAQREQAFADEEASRKKQTDARSAAAEQALTDAINQYAAEKRLRQEEFDIRIAQENADRKLRLEQQAEDYRLEDDARQKALNDKQAAILKDAGLNGQFLNNLGNVMQAARNTIVGWMTSAVNSMNSITSQAQSVLNSAAQAAKYATANYGAQQSSFGNMSYAVNPSSQSWLQPAYSGGGAGGKMTRFAEGGIVPANRAMMGYFEGNRSYPEAVIPLRPHILREIGGGGRPSVTVMMNVNKGALNVAAQPGQDVEAIAVGVVAEFAEKFTPRIMKVIEERIS